MLTASKVQGYIYQKLRSSSLNSLISGSVYRSGYRPRDSRLEDAVVVFTTGTSDQIEEGIVTVNIYVPDIDPFDNGILCEHGQRTAEIESAAASWVESLTTGTTDGYWFTLQQAIYTADDEDINQHFIVIKLKYKYYNN